ncbi:MAG: PAS domain-containing protein, partial [Bacteroidales bacterium]
MGPGQDIYKKLFEILLETGNSLDMYEMLKSSLSVYLKRFDCMSGIVFQLDYSSSSIIHSEMIFSKPYALVTRESFSQRESLVPRSFTSQSLEDFNKSLPVKGIIEGGLYYHIFSLPDLGFLIIVKENEHFEPGLIPELKKINDRIAHFCRQCYRAEKLEESERRFRHHQAMMPEMICEISDSGQITFANNYALWKMGYTEEELKKGINVLDIVHPDYLDIARENLKKALEGVSLPLVEYLLVKKDGQSFPVHAYTNRLIRFNKPEGLITILIDITDIKENNRKLQHYTERLELALLGSNAGLWDWKIEPDELVLSKKWLSIRGMEELDRVFTSSGWLDLIHPDDREKTMKLLNDHLEGKTPFFYAEYRSLSGNGDYIWLSDTAKVMEHDSLDKATRLTGTSIDITARKLNELELQQNYFQQELLSELALELNSLDDFNRKLNAVLRRIGTHTSVSRVYIFEDSADGSGTSNTFEWCNNGISAQKDELQDIPYTIIPSWKDILLNKGRVY